MVQVMGQDIPPWDPELILQTLTAAGKYESEIMMVFSIYQKKGHQLDKELAEGILHSFKAGLIDVMLLSAAGLVEVKKL